MSLQYLYLYDVSFMSDLRNTDQTRQDKNSLIFSCNFNDETLTQNEMNGQLAPFDHV